MAPTPAYLVNGVGQRRRVIRYGAEGQADEEESDVVMVLLSCTCLLVSGRTNQGTIRLILEAIVLDDSIMNKTRSRFSALRSHEIRELGKAYLRQY